MIADIATGGRGRFGAAVLAAALAGCVPYAAAPPQPALFPAALDARALESRPADRPWTGAALLESALAHNTALAASRAIYRTALKARAAASVSPAPVLTLTAEYAGESPHGGFGAGIDLPLGGGRRGLRIDNARLQALQALYNYRDAVWMVRTAIEMARIDLAGSGAELQLAQAAVGLRRERLVRLNARVAAGVDARGVTIAARTDVTAAERRLAEIEARRSQAEVALAAALGVSPAAVRGIRVEPPAAATTPAGLPALRRDAALGRADVLRAIAAYDLAENALRLEVKRQYPEVRIGPGYFYDHGVSKLPVNLSLTLPPLDGNRQAIDEAQAARLAAGKALEAAQAAVLAAVDAAAAALVATDAENRRIEAADVPAGEAALELARRALTAGTGDHVDELAAQAALADTRLTALSAGRARQGAAAALEDALHRAFDGEQAALLAAADKGEIAP